MLEVRAVIGATAPKDDAVQLEDAVRAAAPGPGRRDRLGRVACGAAAAALLAASAALAVCRRDADPPVSIPVTGPLVAEAGSRAP